jgi:hypothetical protein
LFGAFGHEDLAKKGGVGVRVGRRFSSSIGIFYETWENCRECRGGLTSNNGKSP